MKIAFLALSGIRAHDPKLLELGLTLPGFVERSNPSQQRDEAQRPIWP